MRTARETSFRSHSLPLLGLALAALLLFGLAACEPASGPERVTALRDGYEANLNSFNVMETPMLEESGMDGEAMDGDALDGDADAEGRDADADAMEGDEIIEEVPLRQDVMLDVVLRKTGGGGRLDGLTLDVYQVTADEAAKTTYRIWVDTSTLNKGSRQAVSHVIEDIDFEEGDKFAVEVRPGVVPEQYSEYQEYAEAGDGGGEG